MAEEVGVLEVGLGIDLVGLAFVEVELLLVLLFVEVIVVSVLEVCAGHSYFYVSSSSKARPHFIRKIGTLTYLHRSLHTSALLETRLFRRVTAITTLGP